MSSDSDFTFAIVNEHEAGAPFPYVYVTNEGAVHELDEDDRLYLQERFHPGDGGRPYIKQSFESKDGWGEIGGMCARRHIPDGTPIDPEPYDKSQLPDLAAMMEKLEKERQNQPPT